MSLAADQHHAGPREAPGEQGAPRYAVTALVEGKRCVRVKQSVGARDCVVAHGVLRVDLKVDAYVLNRKP
jgi:hypothetical protein